MISRVCIEFISDEILKVLRQISTELGPWRNYVLIRDGDFFNYRRLFLSLLLFFNRFLVWNTYLFRFLRIYFMSFVWNRDLNVFWCLSWLTLNWSDINTFSSLLLWNLRFLNLFLSLICLWIDFFFNLFLFLLLGHWH